MGYDSRRMRFSKKPILEDGEFVYGINPVREVLISGRRICREIFIAENRKKELGEIISLAKKKSVKFTFVSAEIIGKKSGTSVHQGITALVDNYKYISESEIYGNFILIADGIQDPQNLGAIIRSAFLFGVDVLVLPEKGTAGITPTVVKASAGATEFLKIAKVQSLSGLIKNMKDNGFKSFALEADGTKSICDCDYPDKLILIIGGEGHGVRNRVKDACDTVLYIPMKRDAIGSLNASVSTALAVFEVFKQKKCQ